VTLPAGKLAGICETGSSAFLRTPTVTSQLLALGNLGIAKDAKEGKKKIFEKIRVECFLTISIKYF
jgi:hypothetical protein